MIGQRLDAHWLTITDIYNNTHGHKRIHTDTHGTPWGGGEKEKRIPISMAMFMDSWITLSIRWNCPRETKLMINYPFVQKYRLSLPGNGKIDSSPLRIIVSAINEITVLLVKVSITNCLIYRSNKIGSRCSQVALHTDTFTRKTNWESEYLSIHQRVVNRISSWRRRERNLIVETCFEKRKTAIRNCFVF